MEILDQLSNYGFEKEFIDSTFFRITYPDNPNILIVMNRLALAGDNLISGDPRIFTSNGEIPYEPEDFVRLIPEEHIQGLVRSIINLFRENGYFFSIKYTYNPAKVCIFKKKQLSQALL